MIKTLPIPILFQFVDCMDFLNLLLVNKKFNQLGKEYLKLHKFNDIKEYIYHCRFLNHSPTFFYKSTPFISYFCCNDELICLDTQKNTFILDHCFNLKYKIKGVVHFVNYTPYLYQYTEEGPIIYHVGLNGLKLVTSTEKTNLGLHKYTPASYNTVEEEKEELVKPLTEYTFYHMKSKTIIYSGEIIELDGIVYPVQLNPLITIPEDQPVEYNRYHKTCLYQGLSIFSTNQCIKIVDLKTLKVRTLNIPNFNICKIKDFSIYGYQRSYTVDNSELADETITSTEYIEQKSNRMIRIQFI